MKVLVTGSRSLEDKALVYRTLSQIHQAAAITVLIHGGAKGADSHAGEWADEHRVETHVFRPDWKRFGRAGGVIRNEEMANEKPNLCVAFPGKKGTNDMIARARKHGIPVITVDQPCETKPNTLFRWHDALDDAEVLFVTLTDWVASDISRRKQVTALVLHSTFEHLHAGQVVTLRDNDQFWLNSTPFM